MDKKSVWSFVLKTIAAIATAVASFIAGSNLANV